MMKECPNCNALIDIDGIEEYSIITCHECGSQLEICGYDLIWVGEK